MHFHSCCFPSTMHWYYLQSTIPLCLCSLTQASWEKRVLKSLNSMSSELDVPLARMVPQNLSITPVIPTNPHFSVFFVVLLILLSILEGGSFFYDLYIFNVNRICNQEPSLQFDVNPTLFRRLLSLSTEAGNRAKGPGQQMERDGHRWTRSLRATNHSLFYDLFLLTFIFVCSWLRHCSNYMSPNWICYFCVCLCTVINEPRVVTRACTINFWASLLWRSCLFQSSQTAFQDRTQQRGVQTMLSQLGCIYKTFRITFKMSCFSAVNTASIHRSCPDLCESLITWVAPLWILNHCCIVWLWGRHGLSLFLISPQRWRNASALLRVTNMHVCLCSQILVVSGPSMPRRTSSRLAQFHVLLVLFSWCAHGQHIVQPVLLAAVHCNANKLILLA